MNKKHKVLKVSSQHILNTIIYNKHKSNILNESMSVEKILQPNNFYLFIVKFRLLNCLLFLYLSSKLSVIVIIIISLLIITEVYSNKENNSGVKATILAIAIIGTILGLTQLLEGLLQLQKYYFLFLSYRSFSQF